MPSGHVALRLPASFGFKRQGTFEFESVLAWFDWELRNTGVVVDLSKCSHADYQALSLLVLYLWYLRAHGCYVEVEAGPSATARPTGGRSQSDVARPPRSAQPFSSQLCPGRSRGRMLPG